MPVLIILLFYINDLIRIKRYYLQTEFMAHQFVNIIQNISQNRPDKAIKLNDMRYAAALAWLSLYPGTTMYHSTTDTRTNSTHELSHFPWFFIYYVKSEPDGKASVKWIRYPFSQTGTNPQQIQCNSKNENLYMKGCIVGWGTNVEPSSIYPTLKMDDGFDRIIVECHLHANAASMSSNDYNPSDDQATRARKAFRLRLVTPKNAGNSRYFNSVVIFKPKPGLFTEKRPDS
ncbi:MAG: hypothetical protein J5821_02620 [Alphaproteobacteria bacterium]|nr:hypothetical protein [Alphaproteobacteria bacterium]